MVTVFYIITNFSGVDFCKQWKGSFRNIRPALEIVPLKSWLTIGIISYKKPLLCPMPDYLCRRLRVNLKPCCVRFGRPGEETSPFKSAHSCKPNSRFVEWEKEYWEPVVTVPFNKKTFSKTELSFYWTCMCCKI